jgi:hemoglobin
MVVDRFSDEIITNSALNVNPALKEWNQEGKLPGLKFMRTLWACQATGGPFQYTGKPLDDAHEHLHITSGEFDEVGGEIAKASIISVYRTVRRTSSWPQSLPTRKR